MAANQKAAFEWGASVSAQPTGQADEQLAERVAERVVEMLTERGLVRPSGSPELIDAAEFARRLGRSRDLVYAHAEQFGAIKLGPGTRPRLLFPWPPRPAAESTEPPAPEPAPRARKRRETSTELLPIKGKRP